MRAGVQVRAEPGTWQRLEEVVDQVLVEQVPLGLLVDTQPVDRACVHSLVKARRRAVGTEPLDHGRRGHQRVVGLERHRSVAGHAADTQPSPSDTLLADVDARCSAVRSARCADPPISVNT